MASTKEANENTPQTPDIISSLLSVTNPLDQSIAAISAQKEISSAADSNINADNNQNSAVSRGEHVIQKMRSQLIKEELKVTLKKKRGYSLQEVPELSDTAYEISSRMENNGTNIFGETMVDTDDEEASVEDEEKRRKRRERNKIAATKCRLKKKEQATNLLHESELLQTQNENLKLQIQELQVQRNGLVDTLNSHKLTCPLGIR